MYQFSLGRICNARLYLTRWISRLGWASVRRPIERKQCSASYIKTTNLEHFFFLSLLRAVVLNACVCRQGRSFVIRFDVYLFFSSFFLIPVLFTLVYTKRIITQTFRGVFLFSFYLVDVVYGRIAWNISQGWRFWQRSFQVELSEERTSNSFSLYLFGQKF